MYIFSHSASLFGMMGLCGLIVLTLGVWVQPTLIISDDDDEDPILPSPQQLADGNPSFLGYLMSLDQYGIIDPAVRSINFYLEHRSLSRT